MFCIIGSEFKKKNALCRDVINCLNDQSPSYTFELVGRKTQVLSFTQEKKFQSAFEITDGHQLHVPIGLLVNKKNYNFDQVHVFITP